MKSCCHQSCDMRHIYHKHSANLVAHLPETLKINRSGIGTRTCDNHLGLTLQCQPAHVVVIKKAIVIHAIGNHMEILSRHVDRRTVREMSAVVEVHAHNRVARLQDCKLYCHICLCAGVRLHICVVTPK